MVERLSENGIQTSPSTDFHSNYKGKIESIPGTLKALQNLPTAQMEYILNYNGLSITGSRDEIILRLALLKSGQYRLAFYHEQKEILDTISDAEKLILEQRHDYLQHPSDVYRKRTHISFHFQKLGRRTPMFSIQN